MTRAGLGWVLAVCLAGSAVGSPDRAPGSPVNWLAVELLKRGMHEPRNAVCSPYSVGSALALTCAAAAGPTQDQLALALHLPAPRVLPEYAQLRTSLAGLAGPGIEWAGGNRLWAAQPFEEPFVSSVREALGAAPTQLSFSPAEPARQQINSWVAEQTRGQIPELVQGGEITPKTELVLTNALYFKGAWESQFKPSDTAPVPFRRENGKGPIDVPMMTQEGQFASTLNPDLIAAADGFEVLELPYRGGRVVMDVVLPRGQSLQGLTEKLTVDDLQAALSGLSGNVSKVKVFLPRFRLNHRVDLQPLVQQLTGPLPFSAGCDLSRALGPSGRGLPLQALIHAARLDTDETGSTAAAATGGYFLRSQPAEFRADRPFLALLRDNQTGTILFIGRVEDPSQ